MDYLWIKWKEKGRKLEQLINKIMIIDMNTISRTTASRSGKLIHINKQPRWKWARDRAYDTVDNVYNGATK